MDERIKSNFLRKRMIELREKNGKSQTDMAELIGCDKSSLSRAEKIDGTTKYTTVRSFAENYCDALGLSSRQKALFFRGEKIVVVDTSALLKNQQLIDELSKEYNQVIVPKIVVDELDNMKDRKTRLSPKASQIIKSIGNNKNIITMDDIDNNKSNNNDCKIIAVAKQASKNFNCKVDLITCDTGFTARLSGDETVQVLPLEKYMITKQNLIDINTLKKLDNYYADSYDDVERVLGIKIPAVDEINAYLSDGNTLIISVIRNKKKPMNQRKKKIQWLISHGADVNKRDCKKYYFPPLSHAIQNGDFEIFKFLLHECKANPNIGSRNPYDAGKIIQKNEGNMPLMVAAWDNKVDYVKELVADERISINQQDGNGFTALIKACYWGWIECRDILIKAGADTKIVDREGYTAEERYREYLQIRKRKRKNSKRS